MEHTLINPNQLQYYGTDVQDNPFDCNPLTIQHPGADYVSPFPHNGDHYIHPYPLTF